MRTHCLVAVAMLLPSLLGCQAQTETQTSSTSFATADGLVEFQFPGGWSKNSKEHPFDLQCLADNQQMNTGVFVYKTEDMDEGMTAQSLLQFQVDDIKSKRSSFELLEKQTVSQRDGKTVTSVVYAGERAGLKNYYRFSTIEFTENPNLMVTVLQVAMPDDWSRHKPVLEQITQSASLRPAGRR